MAKQTQVHLLMTGGGTLGPVTPLLGVAEHWRRRSPGVRISWMGTPHGPEREVVERHHIPFYALSVPKLSRHKPWLWPFLPFWFVLSCFRAYHWLRELQPTLIFSAGGYTSVPLVWVGRFMGIPSWIHQLDVEPGLANRLMSFAAEHISVTWQESMHAFPEKKTTRCGALVRSDVHGGNKYRFMKRHKLDDRKPTVLILGGGTGAAALNDAVEVIAGELSRAMNVVLLTGTGKMTEGIAKLELDGFVAMEFATDEMADAYAAADVVVARAGMGTIGELVALRKPTILVPIPGSHQEANARALEARGAADVLWKLTPQILAQSIRHLALDPKRLRERAKAMSAVTPVRAAECIVKLAHDRAE